MSIIKMFAKGKLFIFKRKIPLSISIILTTPISIFACAVFYSQINEGSSRRDLLYATPFIFIFIIWIVWRLLKLLSIDTINKYWKHIIISYIILIPFIYGGYHSQILKTFRQHNIKYQVEITPSEDSSGSFCILDAKNNWGRINEFNDSIFDLEITGDWKKNTNDCQFFIDASKTGSIKFNNTAPFNDELVFIILSHPNAGELILRTSTSREEILDFHSEIKNHEIRVVELASKSRIVFWKIINLAGLLSLIYILLIPIFGVFEKIGIDARINDLLDPIRNKSLLIILPLIIFIIILFWRPWSIFSSDVAYYLSLAKNLYHSLGYVDADLSPAIYRGPVLPLLITISYYLFGEVFRSALIMERIFWALTILVSYLIGRKLYNQRTGFLAALFVLSAGIINKSFYYIWTDNPLVFAILGLQLMIWQAYKEKRGAKWYALMGFLMGTAYLLKQNMLFFVPLPLAAWALIPEYRTRQVFNRLLILYLVFAVFFFGWMGYVFMMGGSAGQAAGDLIVGFDVLTYFLKSSSGQALPSPAKASGSGLTSLIQLFITFYQRDVARSFKAANVLLITLVYTLYQAIWRKNQPDIFLAIGLLLFSALIPAQVRVNFGTRNNLYFYCIVLICTAAMVDRISLLKMPKMQTGFLVLITTLLFVYSLLSAGIFKIPVIANNPYTMDYFTEFTTTAAWVDAHIALDEKILISAREANKLHILTTGNRHFEFLKSCAGERSFTPAVRCEPPYISFWVNRGIIDPDKPRDLFMGISEPSLISKIQENYVKYIIVTPRYYTLYFYLTAHPAFEVVTMVDDNAIFRVIHPVQPIASFPDVEWETCVGQGMSEYLSNLVEKNPENYETRLREHIEPWMGLTAQDLETLKKWQGCVFEENFPGEYHLPKIGT